MRKSKYYSENQRVAILAYGYGLKNAGDMAITIGAIQVIQKSGYTIKLISRFNKNNIEFNKSRNYLLRLFPDIEIFESPFDLNRNKNFIKIIIQYLFGFFKLLGIGKISEYNSLIKRSQMIFFNGGNLLRCDSITDFIRLNALMYPLRIARKNKIPYQILPHSASKINFMGKLILRNILREAEILWTREDISFNYLKKTFQLRNIRSSIDLCFFINPFLKKILNGYTKNIFNEKKETIAFTIRGQTVGDLSELNTSTLLYIKKTFQEIIRNCIGEDKNIIFVVQTEKDLNITKDICASLENNMNMKLIIEYDPIKLLNLYSQCDLLIGMRLHSIVLALSAGIPSIGIFVKKWGFKNPGTMQKFDMPYYLINNEEIFEDQISKRIKELIRYKKTINKNISIFITKEKRKFR